MRLKFTTARQEFDRSVGARTSAKFIGVFPTTKFFKSPRREFLYTTLLMSTGLTFGATSSLPGLSHHIITQA